MINRALDSFIYLTGSILNKEKRGLKPDFRLCMNNLPRRKHIKNFLSYIYFEKSNNLKKTSLKHKEKSFTKKSDQHFSVWVQVNESHSEE